MNKINEIPDEAVRHLAQTLKKSGLAASESEAIRMALNMSNTNKKVNQNFEDRKDQTVMGLSHLKKDYSDRELVRGIQDAEHITRNHSNHINNMHQQNIHSKSQRQEPKEFVQEEFKEEGYKVIRSQSTQQEHDCEHCKDCTTITETEEAILSDVPEKKTLNELFKVETEDEPIDQGLINNVNNPYGTHETPIRRETRYEPKQEIRQQPKEQIIEEDDQPEKTQEIPVNPQPKKDTRKYEEAKVDLGAVFKFKG